MKRYFHYVIISISLLGLMHLHTTAQPRRYLVKAKSSHEASAYARHFSQRGMKFHTTYPQVGIQVWEMPQNSRSTEEELTELQARFPHLHIEPDHKYKLTQIPPNDSWFSKQTHLQNNGEDACLTGMDIGALDAWEKNTGDDAIIVIIDGGMDLDHEDLKDNLWINKNETLNGIDDDGNGYIDDIYGWNFAYSRDTVINGMTLNIGGQNPDDDTGGHGTHVAGIIGAKGNNNIGVAGVAWNCRIMPLKFTDSTGLGHTSTAIAAINYAIEMKRRGENIVAINNSWGGGDASLLLKKSIERADSAGILFVAAAGNDGNDNDRLPFYPASYDVPNIISVGATNCRGELASFSNFGATSVDITAPGEAIYSTLPNDKYGVLSGTSMAAPQVSGALLLMRQQYPNDDIYTLKRKLLQNGRSDSRLQGKCKRGAMLHVGRAMEDKSFWGQQLQEGIPWALTKGEEYLWVGTSNGMIRYHLITKERRMFTKDNSGLPSNNIQALVLENDACLWIGTDKGLAKYCEEEWETFDMTNSGIVANDIRDIMFDTNRDRLWLGTWDGGLVSYNSEDGFTPYYGGRILQLEPSYDGNLWAMINQHEIRKFNVYINDWEEPFDTTGLSKLDPLDLWSNSIVSLQEGPDSSLWLLTTKDGILNYQDSLWVPLLIPDSILITKLDWDIQKFQIAMDGTLWLGGRKGIVSYYSGIWNAFLFDGIELPIVSSATTLMGGLYIDAEGDAWISTSKGVIEHNDSLLNYFPDELPLSFSGITDIIATENGELWVGTSTAGLMNQKGDKWEMIDSTGLYIIEGSVSHIAQTPNDTLWIVSQNNRLIKHKDTYWDPVDMVQSPIRFGRINDIIAESDSVLWVGTNSSGLLKYNGNWKIYDTITSDLPDNNIEALALHPNGDIWIITWNYAARFDGIDDWEVLSDSTIIPWPRKAFSALTIDSNGKIWMGTDGNGLWSYDDNEWKWEEPNILGNAEINCLEPDGNANLWIGTEDGLYKYDGTNLTLYDETNFQLPSNKTYALEIAPDGTLWVGTDFGLAQITPDSTASFTLDNTSICLDSTAYFQNNGLQGDSLTWKINDALVAKTQDLIYQFSEAGRYKVELNVYTDVDTSSYSLFVNVQAPVQIDLGPDTTAQTRAVRLSAEMSNIAHYEWTNLASIVLDTLPFLSVDTTGFYILSVEDQCGATDQDIIFVDFDYGETGFPHVLPGDVNGDDAINGLDILLIALKHGITGIARDCGDSTSCTLPIPQAGTLWENNTLPEHEMYTTGFEGIQGTNLMYADADGNGIIDVFQDAEVVRKNANSPHPAHHATEDSLNIDTTSVKVTMELLHREVSIGQHIGFRFYIDGADSLLDQVHGIALSVDLNIPLTRNPSLSEEPADFGIPGRDMYQTYIYDRDDRRIDFVFTSHRNTDIELSRRGRGVGGGGTIAVIEDIDTTRIQARQFPLTLTLGNIIVLDKGGNMIPANPVSIQHTHTAMVQIPPDTAIARLTDFQSICKKGEQFLTWTVWEKNIARYELQYSTDAVQFDSLTAIAGQADSSAVKAQYQWQREESHPVYYRLKMVGKNGEVYYSDTILTETCTVNIDDDLSEEVSISRLYPNPTQGRIQLNTTSPKKTAFQFDLFNLYGKHLLTVLERLRAGEHELNFDISHLSPGLYWARLTADGELMRTEKIVLRR